MIQDNPFLHAGGRWISVLPTPRKIPETAFTFVAELGGAHLLNGVIVQRPMFKVITSFDFAFGPIYIYIYIYMYIYIYIYYIYI